MPSASFPKHRVITGLELPNIIGHMGQMDFENIRDTGMRIIKLKLFPVPVRLHSGSSKLKFRRYFTIFCDI